LLIDLGEANLQRGKLTEAGSEVEEALSLAEEIGDQHLLVRSHRTDGAVKLAAGELAAAEEAAQRALEMSEALGLKPEKGAALRTLGEVLAAHEINEGVRERAGEFFRKAIAHFTLIGNDPELARTLASFADFQDRCGQWQEADNLRSRAEEIFSRIKRARPAG
jgi:tetratricopeptide (TPR) repeat protein